MNTNTQTAILSHVNALAAQANDETNAARRERLNSKIFSLILKHNICQL